MRTCQSCGAQVSEDSKFCASCGAPVLDSLKKNKKTESNKRWLKVFIAALAIVGILCIAIPISSGFAKEAKVKSETNLGNKYLSEGSYEEAILAFEKIISIDSKNIPARIGIAKASIAIKKYDKALKVLNEILDIDKSNSEAPKLLFDLYFTQAKDNIEAKKYDLADEAINKALKLDTKNVEFYESLADLYLKQGEAAKAFKLLELGIANTNSDELINKLAGLRKDFTGNTPGNIANGGRVVERDNWIYIATSDGILRVDKNNRTVKTKVPNTDGIIRDLNIDKEYLYFVSYGSSSAIKKIKLDGSSPKILTTDIQYNPYLTLKNGMLYYVNKDRNIIRMDTEGKNTTTVSKDKCGVMSVGDEWIVYTNENDTVKYSYDSVHGEVMDDTMGKIYRIKPDGSGREQLTEEGSDFINIDGDYIYYGNGSDGVELMSEGDSWYTGKLYKMNLDGTNKKKVLTYASWDLNITDEWIYADHELDLVRINKNTGVEQVIGKDEYDLDISVVDNEVFFTAWIGHHQNHYIYYEEDAFGFYSIKLDNPASTSSTPAPQNNTPVSNTDFIIPYSSERKLTLEDISSLSKDQLGIARNEIYARHGFIFKTDKYKQYFESKSWYVPNASFNESLLSEVEKYNVDFIKQHE